MSSSSPPNAGSVDLESVLNVRRRTLTAIGEANVARQQQYRYTDTIYIKREDTENSLFSIQSKVIIFGELQFLYSIFERYTSNIIVNEDSIESNLHKLSFSTTSEENEVIDEDDTNLPPAVSTVRQTSSSTYSSSPPANSGSPQRYQTLSSIGRSQTIASTTSDYSGQNLEGKRYGSIELPNMMIIEILEILLRNGLEFVDQSSDYDNENVLQQNFVLSKYQHVPQRLNQPLYSRTSSLIGT